MRTILRKARERIRRACVSAYWNSAKQVGAASSTTASHARTSNPDHHGGAVRNDALHQPPGLEARRDEWRVLDVQRGNQLC